MIRGVNTPAVSGAATIADSWTIDPSGSATGRDRRTIAVIASHPAADVDERGDQARQIEVGANGRPVDAS